MQESQQRRPDLTHYRFGRYIAGFALVVVLYPLIVFGLKPLFDEMVSPTLAVVIPLTLLWVLALALLVVIVHVEGVSLTSIGLKRTGWKTIASAVAIGVALMMLVPVLSVIAAALIPATDGGQTLDTLPTLPAGVMLFGILTAAVVEEIFHRGYLIERLELLTGSTWVAGLLSMVFFVVLHTTGWSFVHVIGIVLPLGIIMTLLYIHTRNLWLMIIVHFIIDAPLILIALGLLQM